MLFTPLLLWMLAAWGKVILGQAIAGAGDTPRSERQHGVASAPPATNKLAAAPAAVGMKAGEPEGETRGKMAVARLPFATGQGLRDPFKAPPPPRRPAGSGLTRTGPLPPGPRGLIISQVRLEGIVREEGTHKMLAVVANTANLAYFLRENETLYNGVVTRITPDAVYFQENVRDPDRGMRSREVVMRLGPTPGEAR